MDLKSGSTHIPSPTSVSSVIQAELVNSSQSNEIESLQKKVSELETLVDFLGSNLSRICSGSLCLDEGTSKSWQKHKADILE